MHAQERLINLENAQGDEQLSRPVVDQQGQVLMASGSLLTESTIEALRRRHVETIWVRHAMADVADTQAHDAARRAQHRERLARLFRNVPLHGGSRRLLTLLSRYRGVDPP